MAIEFGRDFWDNVRATARLCGVSRMRFSHIGLAFISASISIAAAAPREPVKLICKDQPRAMGSRLVERVCRTRADWDAMREFARRATADAADKPPNENGLRTTLR